jgi:hypothetical protein
MAPRPRASRLRRGQASTEYLLLVAFLVVAVAAAAWGFLPLWIVGLGALEVDATDLLSPGRGGGNRR